LLVQGRLLEGRKIFELIELALGFVMWISTDHAKYHFAIRSVATLQLQKCSLIRFAIGGGLYLISLAANAKV
jgi:hypothetical protein